MINLSFDDGIKEFEVNGKEILRFNPTDPNLYDRFLTMVDDVTAIEKEFTDAAAQIENADDRAERLIHLMRKCDTDIKAKLSFTFGEENDFDKILGGVSLLAITPSGRVITNLLNALAPIIEQGAKEHLKERADAAVAEANLNREQRRALTKS